GPSRRPTRSSCITPRRSTSTPDDRAQLSRVRAVLFDMDGLLVDSEPLWTVAETELAARLGGVWNDDVKAACVGHRLDAAVPIILRHYDVEPLPAVVDDAIQFLQRRLVEQFETSLPLPA